MVPRSYDAGCIANVKYTRTVGEAATFPPQADSRIQKGMGARDAMWRCGMWAATLRVCGVECLRWGRPDTFVACFTGRRRPSSLGTCRGSAW